MTAGAAGFAIAADDSPSKLAARAAALWASGHFAESEALARLVLSRDGDQAVGHLVLARSLAARLRLDEAAAEAERAIADDPLDPAPYDLLADVLSRLGRTQDATAALSRSLSLLRPPARHQRAMVRRAELRVLRRLQDLHVDAGEPSPPCSSRAASHVVVSIEIRDGRPFVKGRINGGPDIVFLVDTGADRTVVNRDTALEYGLPTTFQDGRGGGLALAGIERLEIGSLDLRHVPALVHPGSAPSSISGGHVLSPLALGLSMTVDYERQELTIGQVLPQEDADIVMPFWFPRLPVIQGEVGNQRYMFIVDTGAVMLSLDAPIALDVTTPIRTVPLRVRDAWGRLDPDAALMLPGPQLTFGDLSVANRPVGIRNLETLSRALGYRVGGLVGAHVLSRFRVTFDLVRRQLRLTHRRDLD